MVKSKYRAVILSLTALVVGMIAGCGGGGATGPAAVNIVTGVAATGAPVAGIVYLKDSSPTPTELTASTASDGSFAFNAAGLTPPFIIKTTSGSTTLYSLATESGIVNITPLTTMALAQAANGANLYTLYNSHVQSDINSVAAKMPAAVKAVQAALAPLMNSFGVTTDILNGQFSANHTGMDALLDAISVSISTGTVSVANKQNGAVIFTAPCTNIAAGSVVAANMPMPTLAPATASPGNALYTAKCAGCHGDLTNSNLKGRATVALAQGAIGSNLGGMGMLSGISAGDIQTIIDTISTAATAQQGATNTPAPTPSAGPAVVDGAALYAANCAGCHGALATSRKQGATAVRLQNAISGNVGGMGFLSKLSAAENQAIVASLNPPVTSTAPATGTTQAPGQTTTPSTGTTSPAPVPDGATLYSTNCAGCHGPLATSAKQGITIARLQAGIAANATTGMGFLSSLTVSEIQAIVTALTPATPTPTPSPVPPPTTLDGAALYASYCGSCHGALASSAKAGASASLIQAGITGNFGGMGSLSSLSAAQISAIETALATVTPPPQAPPSTTPDGAALYTSKCAGCHGALASSNKGGATATLIQTGISSNLGGMGSLSTLTPAEISAIAASLATVTPPSTPAPTPACGSCHSIPPSTGHHSTHMGMRTFTCATCHGSGYSSTTVNAATHNNGVKNIVTTIGWNATTRSCSNSCHGSNKW